MDEHIKINEGKTIIFENDIVDDNLNNLTWWINKHNSYSTREAIIFLKTRYDFNRTEVLNSSLKSTQDKRKKWFKEGIYLKCPYSSVHFSISSIDTYLNLVSWTETG